MELTLSQFYLTALDHCVHQLVSRRQTVLRPLDCNQLMNVSSVRIMPDGMIPERSAYQLSLHAELIKS